MVHFLDFDVPCAANSLPRLGGGAPLPAGAKWPEDTHGKPQLHVMSLPGEFVSKFSGTTVSGDACISVFIPYRHDSVAESLALARHPEAAQVLLYRASDWVQQKFGAPLDPARAITVDSSDEAEDDEFSGEIENKIGGNAVWLQDRVDFGDMKFCMQLIGESIAKMWRTHRGIFLGGVGYLFLHANMPDPSDTPVRCGDFRIQYT